MTAARAHPRGALLITAALACTPSPGASVPVSPAPATAEVAREAPAPAPTPAPAEPAAPPVEVVVRDLEGGVIPGAQVIDDRDRPDEERTHVADAEGVAVVPGGSSVNVRAPGFVTLMRARLPRGGRVDLHLLPASAIVGRVVDRRGQPVVGARVEVRHGHPDEAATTDADGRFRLAGQEPGRRLLMVRGAGVLGDRMVAVGYAEEASVEIVAAPAATIEGRVVHAEDGAPCTSGTVILSPGVEGPAGGCPICGGEDPSVDVSLAADGSARIEVARGLVYGIQVLCDGRLGARPDPIAVADGDVTGLRWEVARGLQIRGKVVDGAGRPVPGLDVFIRSVDDEEPPDALGSREATTDASGRFALTGLRDDASYEVAVFGEHQGLDYDGEGVDLELGERDLEGVVLVVHGEPRTERERDGDDGADDTPAPPPLRVRGLVLDARGEPVEGALIAVDDRVQLHRALEVLARAWDGRSSARSDARGAFEAAAPRREGGLDDPDDDGDREPVTIIAYAPGGAVGLAQVTSLAEPVEIRVRPLAALGVRVRDRRGRPITYFGVDLERERPRPEYVHAPGGVFTIPGLVPGSYGVRMHTPEGDVGARVQVPAERPPAPVIFEARGAIGALSVHLRDTETADHLAGCKVTVSPVGAPRRAPLVTDDEGEVEFADVPAGATQLHLLPCTAGGKRYPAQTLQVQLRPDSMATTSFWVAGHDPALTRGGGDLGYTLRPRLAAVDPLLQPLRVQSLRPGGPAQRAGLRVGDVIVEVGGRSVQGRSSYLYDPLARVPPGARLTLGLADGRSVEVTAE